MSKLIKFLRFDLLSVVSGQFILRRLVYCDRIEIVVLWDGDIRASRMERVRKTSQSFTKLIIPGVDEVSSNIKNIYELMIY